MGIHIKYIFFSCGASTTVRKILCRFTMFQQTEHWEIRIFALFHFRKLVCYYSQFFSRRGNVSSRSNCMYVIFGMGIRNRRLKGYVLLHYILSGESRKKRNHYITTSRNIKGEKGDAMREKVDREKRNML